MAEHGIRLACVVEGEKVLQINWMDVVGEGGSGLIWLLWLVMLMRSRKTLGQDAAAASALTAAIAANPSRKSELEAAGRQLGISR